MGGNGVVVTSFLVFMAVMSWVLPKNYINLLKGALIKDLVELVKKEQLDLDITPVIRVRYLAVAACAALALIMFESKGIDGLIYPLAGLIVSWKMGAVSIKKLETKRVEEIAGEFPTFVNFLKINARVMGIEQAIDTVRSILKGELRKQTDVLSAEMQNMPLSEALGRFSARCKYPPVEALVAVIKFAVVTGSNIEPILDTFAKRSYQNRISEIKKRIKTQPVFLSIVPVILGILILIIFIYPLFTSIMEKIKFM